MKKTLYILLCVIILGLHAQSQIMPPNNVSSIGYLKFIKISWTKSPSAGVTNYNVYRWVKSFPMFVKIADIPTTGLTNYQFNDYTVEAGDRYYYYVTARFGAYESIPSQSTSAKLTAPWNSVVIISDPVAQFKIGPPNVYYYHVQAVSPDTGSVVSYTLLSAPSGMNINLDGEITWSNPTAGFHFVAVKAFVSGTQYKIAKQIYVLKVVQQTGTITGLIQSSTGNAIPKARVLLFNVNNPEHIYEIIAGNNGVYARTDIAAGTYYAVAEAIKSGYGFRWYPNATNFVNASAVVINQGQVTTADFLNSLPENGSTNTVSGFVKDSLGNPIANATVSAFLADKYFPIGKDSLRSPQSVASARSDVFSTEINVTTNSNGQFSINLPQGKLFYLSAQKNGYRTDFRGNKNSPFDAQPLNVNSNPDQTIFSMKAKAPSTYNITGKLLDANSQQPVVVTPVILVQRGGGHVMFMTVKADSTGQFEFDGIPPGMYSIIAAPIGNYIPSYHKNTGSTFFWDESDSVEIINSDVTGIDIDVPSTKKNGLASIAGQVTDAATNLAIPALSVFAFEASDTTIAVAYAITDSNGYYKVDGLVPGNYILKTDKGGYHSASTSEITVNYTGSISITNITIAVTLNNVTVIQPQQPTEWKLEQNYPNPFSIHNGTSTNISYSIPKSAFIKLKVCNLLGQEITSLVNEFKNPGAYTVAFDAAALSSGVYIYQLQTSEVLLTKLMVVIR